MGTEHLTRGRFSPLLDRTAVGPRLDWFCKLILISFAVFCSDRPGDIAI